ncbi:MAG TPA: VWA domain-containing protein [Vicinamibacterales bacterium]|nr:VWA domain-containing protein [Vicinamibacterales bacterium]
MIGRVSALLVAAAVLQQAPPPPAPPTFQSATEVVEVDVVVHDKTGAFVRDLSIDDFAVEDEGRPQRVEQLYLHLMDAPPRRDALQPGSFVPRVERNTTGRTFVALFDSDHLTAGGFKRTRDAAAHLFDARFLDGVDLGGIVVDGRVVNNRLTRSRDELLKALKSASPALTKSSRMLDERQWPRMSDVEAIRIRVNMDDNVRREVIRRAMQDDPTARQELVETAVDVKAADLSASSQAQTNRTMQTAIGVLNGLERMPGRKTLLFLTEGFVADESWPLVKDAVARAARADVRVYSLDARGLDRGLRGGQDVNPGGQDAGQRLLEQLDFGGDAMNSLAVDTGGFVVRNANDFAPAIDRIVDDASNYYVLGYRPGVPQDGKFHRLSVKVKRPGVSVRARRGYVATPKPAAPTSTAERAAAPAEREGPGERDSSSPAARADAASTVQGDRSTAVPTEAAEPTLTNAPLAQGLRFRPDAASHVDMLLKGETADAAAQSGWEAYQRGDVAAARSFLSVAAAAASAHPWVHYALGLSQYALRDFKESAAEWEAVRRAEPAFEPVYFDLVDSYLQLHEHDEAVKVLRAARERWPRDPEVYDALGVVQTSRGVIDDAVKAFQDAVALAPQSAVSQFNLGRALEMRYTRTRRYVQQLQRWVSNERDRSAAIEHYKACIALGGPFAQAAQEGVTRLDWKVQ